eukprot:scaffold8814_cov69-Phaeocystis_antarctica.AAC.4
MPLERRSAEREVALVLESSDGDVASFSFTITSVLLSLQYYFDLRDLKPHTAIYFVTRHTAQAPTGRRIPPPRARQANTADALRGSREGWARGL